jgi:hypothetical protein
MINRMLHGSASTVVKMTCFPYKKGRSCLPVNLKPLKTPKLMLARDIGEDTHCAKIDGHEFRSASGRPVRSNFSLSFFVSSLFFGMTTPFTKAKEERPDLAQSDATRLLS